MKVVYQHVLYKNMDPGVSYHIPFFLHTFFLGRDAARDKVVAVYSCHRLVQM